MNQTFAAATLVAAIALAAPLVVAAQEEERPAEEGPARSYATEDDFFFTQALFCAIQRCGFSSYQEAATYAEVGWNDLRAQGYTAAELHELACANVQPCGEDAFTATLTLAPGARTDLVVDPVPESPRPPLADETIQIEEMQAVEEIEVQQEVAREEEPRRNKSFIRPNLQVGLSGGLWALPGPADTGRMLQPRVLAGGMLDVVLARGVISWGVGFDEEYHFYRSMTLGAQVGPMFGDGDGRFYVAGTFGASWLQVDYALMRGQYGGIEVGAYGTTRRIALMGVYLGMEIHGTRMNTFIEYPDGTIIHGGRPNALSLYCGFQFGF
jgi:hypothetical protein